MTTTTTTTVFHLILQGIPVDLHIDDLPRLAEIKSGLLEAKRLGFEGQPLNRGFAPGGPGKGRPAPATPVRNAAGKLCCPTHGAAERRAELARKEWARGPVWVCGCKDGEAYCAYKIEPADYDRFEASVPKSAALRDMPATPAPAPTTPPRDVPEARQRFYARYGEYLESRDWRAVQDLLQDARPEPRSIEAWIAVAEEVRAIVRARPAA